MQENEDAGRGGAGPAGPHAAAGIHTNPERVELHASGWATSIGVADGMTVTSMVHPEKKLTWLKIELGDVKLSRAAALLVAQGMRLQALFPPDLRFVRGGASSVPYNGNVLLLLRALPPSPLQVSPTLQGVVLGLVLQAEGLDEEEIRGEMLATVLGS
jgi:hypothetical protein